MRAVCLLLGLLCCSTFASAADAFGVAVRARTFRPGELIVFDLTVPPPASDVRVSLFDRTVAAYRLDGARWQAMVGIDLDQRPGAYDARVDAIEGTAVRQVHHPITIARRQFPTRNLRVAPDYVNPPREQTERIAREQALTRGIYDHPSPLRLWDGPFMRPVPQPANSRFGTRSVYNGERRSPHAGTDFMSPAGTPIKAPNAGRIVCARELFFTGNTVIIDHGLGVFSLMAHMSRLDVTEGAEVNAGEQLGLVGATGRVTGPHLHWAMAVSGARVDPLSVLALLGRGETPGPAVRGRPLRGQSAVPPRSP
jgi:murein DD-endopeptidase MepM/ murein hydrolase activator NlpD